MKILVLMPLDEKFVYTGVGLFKALPQEIKDKTFCMPMFMDYLVQTKRTRNYEWALMDTMISAVSLYKTAVNYDDDLLIIGNMPSQYKFDIVFNFQDPEEEEPYKDEFVENFVKIVKKNTDVNEFERQTLLAYIDGLHAADESKLSLVNFTASADFLTAYMATDPKLDKIRKDYDNRLKELKDKITKNF